ncbi:MAG: patatin family protein [Ruminococcaceae bacterium]|nr:patatin family protein [Oscillospiraceae bacterium]
MKKGLVMEGGGMRGLFTAGVIDVLMENGISFDGAVGVSAGACFGCNYKSRQTGRVLRYNTKYCKDKRYCSFKNLIKTGDLFSADFCYRQLPYELDVFDYKAFEENPMEFFVAATDVETGKPVYHKCKDGKDEDLLWFRASASMPLAARIVETDGKKLLDGGIADSIPLEFFENMGYEKNVVILTQPKGYVKSKNKLIFLIKLVFSKYPKLIETLKNRHKLYNIQTKYVLDAEREGRAFVISPSEKLPAGRVEHDPETLKKAYNIGRQEAQLKLEDIKAFLGYTSENA